MTASTDKLVLTIFTRMRLPKDYKTVFQNKYIDLSERFNYTSSFIVLIVQTKPGRIASISIKVFGLTSYLANIPFSHVGLDKQLLFATIEI